MYVVAPFYRAFGFTTTTTRVPAAIAGVLTIALVYSIGAKLFDPGTGAVAALLLSVNPWHLQQSRWGHMSTMFPLAVAAATEWFSEHLLNPGARRVTQVAIHSASAQANSDIANV